ncbi:prohead protease/major capsid protein fusion protein [Hyphomicrobium sulfonivorans]|uniref:prohead protease/major capsid protein fusion protein n=1 Tax=Hyphomicrobium sulfonivorans TaxID=121290 RepID=UPI001570D27D|nr:prohead protease/major capsid protein fusion protein [Hyphomicrobium sulfonivorans]MBI1649869.1 HK97 family phage prohead protease [Hyphomicrobium sulfonivorans]NSL71780.1 peptidase [Hyphomicrobium sulfonivorans]
MAKARKKPTTNNRSVSLPSFLRTAEVRANSYNEDDNTIDVIWSTGAKVRRYSWAERRYYDEVLVMEPSAIRMGRLNAGAPLLDSHNQWSLRSVLGSIVPGTAKVSGGKGTATIKLSRSPDDAATVDKIKDGIIRNISVGYIIHRIEKIDAPEGGVPEWRVLDWEPTEVSAVPVPADAGAQVRAGEPNSSENSAEQRLYPCEVIETRSEPQAAESKEAAMADDNTNETTSAVTEPRAAPVDQAPVEAQAPAAMTAEEARRVAQEAVRAERDRAAGIRALAAKFRAVDFGAEHIEQGTTLEAFRTALMDRLEAEQERNEPNTISHIPGPVQMTDSMAERRNAAIQNAVLNRADPSVALTEDGRDFRGLTLIELARESLEIRGIRTRGMTRLDIAQHALQPQFRSGGLIATSDFATILSNVANITLRAAYDAAPQTFRPLVRVTSVSDFKPVTRAQLGEAPSLEKVNEHGEFKRGAIKDGGETYRVETFGKIVGITRQVIINDDLEALTRLPRAFGQQAAQLESDIVWAEIMSNPTMGDGVKLFHADHKNLASAGAGITVGSVSDARLAIAHQTGLDGKTVLNLAPSYIIVPGALVTHVEQFLSQIYAAKPADAVPNSLKQLTPISDPRLDLGIGRYEIAGSPKAWYMAASPAQIDLIELAYLEGNQGVYTETRQGFDVDGVELKVRMDVGAKVIDHRGLFKNAGQ